MPRVHGIDADQRRRPHRGGVGGGIFALSTPFQRRQQQCASSSPLRHNHHDDDDDMEFRGTQTQAELIMPPPPPSAASLVNDGHNDEPASIAAAVGEEDHTAAAMTTAASMLLLQSSHENNNPLLQLEQREHFEDGMENDNDNDDDSDATTLDGNDNNNNDDGDEASIDLLAAAAAADDDDGTNARKNGGVNNQTKNHHPATTMMMMMSPISPATQTLDRLSRFGSQEGGAELCIRLLDTATTTAVATTVDESRRRSGKKMNDGGNVEGGMKEKKKIGKDETNQNEEETMPKKKAGCEGNGVIDDDDNGFSKTGRKHHGDNVNESRDLLQELKRYFMSTKNSSTFAQKQQSINNESNDNGFQHHAPPTVSFCHKCKANNSSNNPPPPISQQSVSTTAATLPHHGLCPHHPDFYNSGSYEILNLIVDGNLLGCDACIYQFEKGRLNKKLVHGNGCKRRKKNKKSKKQKEVGGGGGGDCGKTKTNKRHHNGSSSSSSSVDGGSQASSSLLSPTTPQMRSGGTSTRPKTAQRTPPPPQHQQQQQQQQPSSRGPFEVGTLVFVQDRQWPGMNDSGGVARITKVHADDTNDNDNDVHQHQQQQHSTRSYDVSYIIESRKMKGIEERFISLHTDYVSPAKELLNDQSSSSSSAVDIAAAANKFPWSVEEDMELVKRVREHGEGNWKAILDNSRILQGRYGNAPSDVHARQNIRSRWIRKHMNADTGLDLAHDDESVKSSTNSDSFGSEGSIESEDEDETVATMAKNANQEEPTNASDAAANDENIGGEEQEEDVVVDDNGHPLSEYERLRLRNIRRNEARLKQLGLLGGTTTSGNYSNENNDQASSSSLMREGGNNAAKKKKKAGNKATETKKKKLLQRNQPSHEMERRTQPKRQKAKRAEGGVDDGSRSTTAMMVTAAGDSTSTSSTTAGKVSLADAAKLGCKKCIAELQTGEKARVRHDLNCPLKTAPTATTTATTNVPATRGKTEEDVLLLVESSIPTLMDAAKAGCQKCTLEWQTDEADTTMDHDICCPRARKKAPSPPGRLEQRQPSRTREEGVGNTISTVSNADISPAPCSNSRNVERSVLTAKKTAKKSKKSITPSRDNAPRRQPTPSPVVTQIKCPSPPPPPPPLPKWIKEFIIESNRHNETVPAPRGSKWLPCPNPWGKIGHEDGDFVIISPFQSETESDILSIFHQDCCNDSSRSSNGGGSGGGGIPKRFVANPFEEGSPYHATHKSPARGDGYCVLRLRRDRVGLRPWGFTVRLHEFGCACLVDGIEPLSPAEAAMAMCAQKSFSSFQTRSKKYGTCKLQEDISGWSNETSSSGLQLHDMIICINGKSIGSMTMPELQIELDVCGPELMLVVSRFDIQENRDCTTLEDLAMDWNEIGAGASLKRKRVSFEDENSNRDIQERMIGQSGGQQGHKNDEFQLLGYAGRSADDSSQAIVEHVGLAKNDMQPSTRSKKGNESTKLSHNQANLPAPKRQASDSKVAKRGSKVQVFLSDTQQHELRTVSKGTQHYESGCPRQRESNKDDAVMKDERCIALDKGHGSDYHGEKTKSQPSVEKQQTIVQVGQVRCTQKAHESTQKHTHEMKSVSRYQKQLEELSDDESDMLPKMTVAKTSKINPSSKKQANDNSYSSSSSEDEYEEEGGDENPWLGCVCGKTHPHPIKVFWIQCEGCDAWYNVAQECVGFDARAADKLDEWCCWACDPPVAGLGL
ncbi:hypothetical protein ACHAXR_010606 [Thalassiosira sp. AJA248-18]